MLAFICFFYLVRNMDNPPRVLSAAELDFGFLCFAIFCMLSTLATIFIRPPQDSSVDTLTRQPLLVRFFGLKGVAYVTWATVGLFILLLSIGMVTPCMTLSLNDTVLLYPNGPVPTEMAGQLHGLNLNKAIGEQVTMVNMLTNLCIWTARGELLIIFAVLLINIFVVAIPVLDMLVLGLAAHSAAHSAGQRASDSDGQPPAKHVLEQLGSGINYMQVAHTLHHVGMLDVFVMGVVIVALAVGGMYSDRGLVLSLARGIVPLLLAEIVHHAMHYNVAALCKYSACSKP